MGLTFPAMWHLSPLRGSALEAQKQPSSSVRDERVCAPMKLVMDPAFPFHTIFMCHEIFFLDFLQLFNL